MILKLIVLKITINVATQNYFHKRFNSIVSVVKKIKPPKAVEEGAIELTFAYELQMNDLQPAF